MYFIYPGHLLVTSLGFFLELSGEALGCALLFCVDVGSTQGLTPATYVPYP